ncbi:MAG: hypothetical protein GY940_10330, partial [bacterium]|nr:hypothetical protein [bacterium]
MSGQIDFKCFKQAWNTVVETNEMLSTRLKWKKVKAPVKKKKKNYSVPVVFHDLSTGDTTCKRHALKEIKDNDRAAGFDLNTVPFRVTLCKVREDHYEMIVSNHHILYDGWSNGILLKEFFSFYMDFTRRSPNPERPFKTKFKEYINRIQNQDAVAHRDFWRTYLQGFETGTGLSIKRKKEKNRTKFIAENVHIDVAVVLKDKLDVFTMSRKLTPACLFYCAWGVLCQRYSNSEDVLFGTTVSGRSGNIKGIENIVGLFVNTIPLRVRTKENTHEKLGDFLDRLNNRIKEREMYESTSLVEIKESSGVSNEDNLFDTIFVIENYPLEKALHENKEKEYHSLAIDSYSIFESTPYDLTVSITPFDGIGVDFSFNRECFDPQSIERLAGHFMNILEDMIHHPGKELARLELLSEAEKKQVIHDFNDTGKSCPEGKTIHGLFEEQVGKTPHHIALEMESRCITYHE